MTIEKWLKPLRYFGPIARFYLNLSLLVSLIVSAIYFGIYTRNNALLLGEVKDRAASYFDLIVRTRRWNASYKGVFVEKRPGVETNPYLARLGIQADVQAADGRVFTLRNPALMTKEISKITEGTSGVKFHITSRNLVNPENAPDDFENRSLVRFEKGEKEAWEVGTVTGHRVFRYMAPLFVEAACLGCHVGQGYRVGDVRGGISISIPFSTLEQRLGRNRNVILALSVFTVALILTATYLMLGRMVGKLERAQQRLKEISVTDELTGLRNRRHVLERYEEEFRRARRLAKPLAVMMIDIDHFKHINDTHGHLFGDLVLKTVAARMSSCTRGYDVAGRYGGEEFLVVLPETEDDGVGSLAGRVLGSISEAEITDGRASARVTASIGTAVLTSADTDSERLLTRADQALYRAKEAGRNRVET